VRFGDPETQAVLPRLADDLLERLVEAAEGRLTERPFAVHPAAAVAVVVASRGYPASSEAGVPIEGVEGAEEDGALVFHAGTALRDGRLVTAGGRVLAVSALGEGIGRARAAAYAAADHVRFAGSQRRTDIARAAAEQEAGGG
jgi:phosphoribosylamine--glycine ligase